MHAKELLKIYQSFIEWHGIIIAFSITAKPLVYLNAEIFKDFYQTEKIPKLKHEKFVPFEMGELTLKGNITINFGKYSGNSGIHCRNAQGIEVVPPGKHLGNSISEMATKLKDFVNSPQFRNAKTDAEAEKYWGS